MSEKAPLQNQFSERMRMRRPGVERSRCQGNSRISTHARSSSAKIGAGKIRVVTHPALMTTGATARKILQHWAPVDGFSCFAGLE